MVSMNKKDKWGPWIVEIRRKNKHVLFIRVQSIVSKTQVFFFCFLFSPQKRPSMLWKTPSILPAVMRTLTWFFLSLHSLIHSHLLILCESLITCVVFVFHVFFVFPYRYGMRRCPPVNSKQQRNDVPGLESYFQWLHKRAAATGNPKRYIFTVGKPVNRGRSSGKAHWLSCSEAGLD